MNEEKVYIYHTKPGDLPDGYRATIALRKVEGGYRVAVSLCNPSDRFIKRKGLDRAKGRTKSLINGISSFTNKEKRDEIVKDTKEALKVTIEQKHPSKNTLQTFFDYFDTLKERDFDKIET